MSNNASFYLQTLRCLKAVGVLEKSILALKDGACVIDFLFAPVGPVTYRGGKITMLEYLQPGRMCHSQHLLVEYMTTTPQWETGSDMGACDTASLNFSFSFD